MRPVAAAFVLWLIAFATIGGAQPGGGTAQAPSPVPDQGYLGSQSCQRCHEKEYTVWDQSLHVQMTKPVAQARIVGDFRNGTTFSDHGRSYEFGTRQGKPFMRVSAEGRPPETYSVDYTLGAKRYQGYLSTLPDGRIYVLPAFWHIDSGRWVDWKDTTPIPDGAHDLKQIWNANCFNCHATNLAQGFDVPSKTYTSTWTEMGIGCEACHGPGRAHVATMDAWKKDPRAKPGPLEVFSTRLASPRQTYDLCAYCHGNKKNVFVGFTAGARYEDYALPFLVSDPIPDNDLQGEFWPDGRPNRFNRPQALTLSGCFKAGAVSCTSCHVAHGSKLPYALKVDVTKGSDGDQLCVQCHQDVGAGGARGAGSVGGGWASHTFHKAESEGSRCINCHMSDVNWRLLIRRRDHTFQAPVPEMTAKYGVPNACTTCHDEKTPEWAANKMEEWWGDGERRTNAVALADTMYRAGSGDQSVIPLLARYAVDRSQGALVRASAADYIGRLATGTVGIGGGGASQTSFGGARNAPSSAALELGGAQLPPAILNALVGAAADPEPTVRASAVRSLGAIDRQGNDRVLAAVLARLTDETRVVRVRAAQALLAYDIVTLPGRAGEVLARVQDELITSYDMFPDSASNHAERAWLESQLGRVERATAAADAALHVEPKFARPLVIKGVLAARDGRYRDAVDFWKQARAIDPRYPNLDKLIEEAEKRRQ